MANEDGYALFLGQNHPDWGVLLTPFESSWLMASPIVSREPFRFVDALADVLATDAIPWNSCLFAGFTVNSPLYIAVFKWFHPHYTLFQGPKMNRVVASLADGLDGYLNRRTPKFRQNLRRTERQVYQAGFTFEWLDPDTMTESWKPLFRRMLAVEDRSWKGLEGHGMATARMRRFYRQMMARHAQLGQVRLGFAVRDGEDVGYIFGAVTESVYRGYQFSFDDTHKAYSLGNWMQLQMIERLCSEGVRFYNLGQDMAYKHQWGERAFETVALIVARR